MDKKKSLIIVAIFSIMFGTLIYCFYEIMSPAFIVIISILSAYGFLRGIIDFQTWLLINENQSNVSYDIPIKHEDNNEQINYDIDGIIDEFKEKD